MKQPVTTSGRHVARLLSIAMLALMTYVPTSTVDAAEGSLRIINGTNVPAGKYPWMVALLQKGNTSAADRQFCGGSLIDRQWVLTAAHCLAILEARNIEVVVNTVNLRGTRSTRYDVAEIIGPTTYEDRGIRDIALLRLKRPVPRSVPVLKLVERGRTPRVGTPLTTMGFGITESGRPSPRLKEIDTRVAPVSLCRRFTTPFVPAHEICVRSPRRDKSSCQGDSGGPIIARQRDGTPYQIGVTSWGNGRCDTDFASVYARLDTAIPWITRQLNGNAQPGESTDLSIIGLDYCVGLNCVFDAGYAQFVDGRTIRSYSWQTDDGGRLSGPKAQVFEHRFRRPGRHEVTLSLIFAGGRATKKFEVNVTASTRVKDRYKVREFYAPFMDGRGDIASMYASGNRGGFFYKGPAVFKMTGPAGTNFDLFLTQFNFSTDRYEIVNRSTSPGSRETIRRNLPQGFYALFVVSANGRGSALVENTVWRSRRDVCMISGLTRCR